MAVRLKISIYFILTITSTWVATDAATHIGCYKEQQGLRYYLYNPGAYNPNALTPDTCSQLCGGMNQQYAVLAFGRACFCGTTAPSAAGLSLDGSGTYCTLDCTGTTSGEKCGSGTHINVYDATPPITNVEVTASTSATYRGQSVTVQGTATSAAATQSCLDFDDQAGMTDFQSPATSPSTRAFYQSGNYPITFYVTNMAETIPSVKAATYVHVGAPANGITITCPAIFATYKSDMCTIEVASGTGMELNVNYQEGSLSFPIADATEFAVGSAINTRAPSLTTVSGAGLILNHINPVMYDGVVVGYEYLAVSPGLLTFYILSPVCAAGQEYCYDTHTCVATGTCEATCPGLYCAPSKACLGSCPAARGTVPPVTSYTVKHKMAQNVGTGHGFLTAPPEHRVTIGDIVAYEFNSTSSIGYVVAGAGEVADVRCGSVFYLSVGDTVSASGCAGGTFASLGTEIHQFKAVSSIPSTSTVSLEFTNTGSKSLVVTATNTKPGVTGSDTNSTTVTVLEGVDIAEFENMPVCATKGLPLAVNLKTFTGAPWNVNYNFGNGVVDDLVYPSPLPYSYTYNTLGSFNISVNISNAISFQTAEMTICVQEALSPLTLVVSATNVKTAEDIPITLQMTEGSDYTCTFTFTGDDGTSVTLVTTETATPKGSDFLYTFTNTGTHLVSCTCTNAVSSQSDSVQLTVFEALEGLSLAANGAKVDEEFFLTLVYTQGSDLTFTLTYDGQPVAFTHNVYSKNVVALDGRTETQSGTIPVTFTGANSVSSASGTVQFAIDGKITSVFMNCVYPPAAVYIQSEGLYAMETGGSVDCSVSTNNDATSVHVDIDWGDGSTPFTHYLSQGQRWDANLPSDPAASHTFSTAGFCDVTVTVSNYESFIQKFPVQILNSVAGVTLAPIPAVAFVPPAHVSATFVLLPGPVVPSKVTCILEWGDNSVETIEDCDLQSAVTHDYSYIGGDLQLVYTLTNWISSVTGSTTVQVITPIVGVVVGSDPQVGTPMTNVRLTFSSERGPDGNNLQLTFRCGDPANTVITKSRVESSPYGVDYADCSYPAVGTYTATVDAQSQFETVSTSYAVVIENPVDETKVSISANAPMDAVNGCGLTLTVTYAAGGLPIPAGQVEVDYADGTSNETQALAAVVTFNHAYASPGHYVSRVWVWNDAGQVIKDVNTGCYEAFINGVLEVRYKPFLPLDGNDLPGLGSSLNIFPEVYPLMLHVSWDTATVEYYEITAVNVDDVTDVVTCNTTDQNVLQFDLPLSGEFTLTVVGHNPVRESAPLTAVVIMSQTVSGISVSASGPMTNVDEVKTFSLSFNTYDPDMCLAIINGQESGWYLYGNDSQCQTQGAYWNAQRAMAVQSLTSPFDVAFTYTSKGPFTLEVYAFNTYSNANATFDFTVSDVDCSPPTLSIQDQHLDFSNPEPFLRSGRTEKKGIVQLNCQDSLDNSRIWTCDKWDANTDTFIASIDIANVESAQNLILVLDPNFLEYGLYRLQFTMTMRSDSFGNGETFSQSMYTFIEVVPSPLYILMAENGENLLSVGPAEDVTLDATQFSYDPDDPDTKLNSFTMKCRKQSEAWEEHNTTFVTLPLPGGHVDAGGCFRQGSGWILPFADGNGIMTFNTAILDVNEEYEFLVYGFKDTRTASTTFRLKVFPVTPPKPLIRFLMKKIFKDHPNGKLFRPKDEMGLTAATVDACDSCSFFWEIYAESFEWKYVTDGWMPVPDIQPYIDGRNSQQISILPSLFEKYSLIDTFRVKLTATDSVTGGVGETEMRFLRNRPPYNGTCVIAPDNGTSSHTDHVITCSGFIDDSDDITYYSVYCLSNGRQNMTVASGEDQDPTWTKQLPIGDENDGYRLLCYVEVKDSENSVGTYQLNNVTSSPMSEEDLKRLFAEKAANLKDDTMIFEKLGNLEAMADMVSSIASMQAQSCKTDENGDYLNQATSLSHVTSSFGETGRQGAFKEPAEENEEARAEYELARNNEVVLVERIALGLEGTTIMSQTHIEIATSATKNMAALAPDKVNRNSQKIFTGVLGNVADRITDIYEECSLGQVTKWTENIVEAVGGILAAVSVVTEHPSDSDLIDVAEETAYIDTRIDSPAIDYDYTDDPRVELRRGRKGVNKLKQRESGKDTLRQLTQVTNKMGSLIGKMKTKSRTPTVVKGSKMELSVTKNSARDVFDQEVTLSGGSAVFPPVESLFPGMDMENTTVVLQAVALAQNPLATEGGLVDPFSRMVSFSTTDENGNELKISNADPPIKITIPRDQYAPVTNATTTYSNPVIIAERGDFLYFHKTIVTTAHSAIFLKFTTTNSTGNQLLVMCKHESFPTHDDCDHVCMIPSHTSLTGQSRTATMPDPNVCFVPDDVVDDKVGEWFCGVRQLTKREFNQFPNVASLPDAEYVESVWKPNKEFHQNYILDTFSASCGAARDGTGDFTTTGVTISALSVPFEEMICLTKHLTTFAGGWVVAPNTIDWNFVFSNADFFKNPTLYITEIVIAAVYILSMIWARRADRNDVTKLGLAPLLDNDPKDKYYYEIMVSTGMRRGGGTQSKVHFILTGEEDESEVRTFTDMKRKIFQRGNLDGFLMAVPSELGALSYLRIWHDNSGKGKDASWYLNHITIRDVQTDKRYFFIADKWFAVEEGDGQVDRVIPVAGKAQMTEFKHLFAERASKNLSDGHLWFSVIARPPQSRFTRTQRVSCCLCLLYMTMLANAMFYGQEMASANALTFGPFALSPEQIFIGIACNLIIFPVNFLIITLFRKSRPRKKRPSRVEEALKAKPQRTTSMTDVNPQMGSSWNVDRAGSSLLMDGKRSESSLSRPDTSLSTVSTHPSSKAGKGSEKDKKCQLPWWFTIVAWILLWLSVLVSAAFVTFYGIMFQDIKCKKWITSMLISFFTSVFVTQPIKVFLFAIFFSLIIKNPGGREDEDEDEEECKLSGDEEMLHKPEEDAFGFAAPRKALYKPKPPDQKALVAAREQRLKEIKMWAVIREIVFYAFFLWILMVISYKSISTNSYYYKYSMEQVFILTNDTNHSFKMVKNMDDFWVWAQSGLLRGLRAGPYYNNWPPFYMRGYINDKVSRLMGYAVMRQVRIKPHSCRVPSQVQDYIHECNDHYDMTKEENGDYAAGWEPLTNANDSRPEYTYRTADSLNGYPYWGEMAMYGGGGYVVELNGEYFSMVDHFRRLEAENWVDKYTRAVFIEFTVYNPSINMFSVSTLLSEFRPSGGVFPTYRFEPCTLLPYMSSVLLFQIACEIIYFLFTLYFIINLVRQLYKEKWGYFRQFWNLIELCICAMSITAIVIYFYRLVEVNVLTNYFKETNGNDYMKFQYVGYWSELFNYIIGFLCFLASLKFLKLLRFNKRISMLAATLKNSGKALIHFSIIFNIMFLAFIQLFYLVYVSNLSSFKTFTTSCESGIVMMMGKFDIYNMLMVNQWFTQVFIFLFVVTITFIVVNMFLSILNETFGAVRNDAAKQENDYEIVDFMMNRFKLWTGLGAAANTTISPADMESDRNRHYRTIEGQIDYFPSQIDRFLSSISHMYVEKSKFDDFLRKGALGKMAMKANMSTETRHPAPGATRLSHGAHGRGMTDVVTD